MKQSQLFTKTIKEAPKDEVSLNAQLLIRAGYIDKLMAGVYTLLPLGFRVFKKVEQIIRDEMSKIEGQELYMPTIQPKSHWTATERWDEVDVLFKLEMSDKKLVALGPTHEEVISPLAEKYVNSYNDLPFAAYHIQNKFRNEKRAKSGILRGREFIMKDLYSFHASQECLDEYYERATQAYVNIFDRAGIGEVTYKTYASGGTFSKYSHEFQTLTDAGEDIIYICDKCKVAINKEIIEDQEHKCPECGSADLKEDRAVEVGNIFKLGTKFSEPFNLKYTDKEGKEQKVIMGCYGIGLQRLMGTVVEVSNDENGIIWPESIAPFKVHLISISKNKEAEELYKKLVQAGIEVLYDDREKVNPGAKFKDADLIGCPYRLVISNKTLREGSVEFKRRDSEEVEMVVVDEVIDRLINNKQ